eukprot:scaffold2657_cov89-Amphora_coffeaeformis.AAC.37
MSFATLSLTNTGLVRAALVAGLDVVPVFWKHPHRASQPTGPFALLPLYVGVGGILLALNDHTATSSIHIATVSVMLLRRLLSRPVSRLWPKLLGKKENLPLWLQTLADGGPLGAGCAKVVHSAMGVILVAWWNPEMLHFCTIGPLWPTPWLPAVVAGVSLAVNGVLYAWSAWQKSRGDHDGVNRMVESTVGRALSLKEKSRLFVWAAVNAAAEELAARGLQRAEFEALFSLPSGSENKNALLTSNLAQASVFGIAHYHGIPSGWTGVGLTFVYGLIMGLIADTGGGLLYAIAAHTIADYFIFATIARRKVQ